MNVTEITPLESLAQHSLRQHIEMVELLRPLQLQLETPSHEAVTQFNVLFSSLQQKMRITDTNLVNVLQKAVFPASITELLGQRQLLQKEIIQMVRQSASRANSVKSLMASEIQSVRNGRKALNGYKIQSDRQGKIVNRTS
jgi:hypothetical protein